MRSIGDLFAISGGLPASRAQLGARGHCYLHYGDIHTSSRYFVDVDAPDVDLPRLDIRLSDVPAGALLRDGDVVFVDASEDDEGTSKHQVVRNLRNVPFIAGLHTIVAKSKGSDLFNGYRSYCFRSQSVIKQFLFYSAGTKVSGISKTNISKICLSIPSLSEQKAIAGALSDADALIEPLEQLIAKKRQIKQGAMQELLTGKRRLPGFTGPWKQKRLGNFAKCVAGGTPSTLVPGYWSGSIRWMNSGELNLKMIAEVEGRISEAGLRNSSTRMVPVNSVLIGLAGQGKTRGTVAMNQVPICTNQSIAAVLPNSSFESRYLYYNLDSRYEELRELSTGEGGRGGLNLTIIRSLPIPLPPPREQSTIAEILWEMDVELDALETKLTKARRIKLGMMQELLTGRIRLI